MIVPPDNTLSSYTLCSKIELPVTVADVFVDGINYIVTNVLSPTRIKTSLNDSWEYSVLPVSKYVGTLYERRTVTAASGMVVGEDNVAVDSAVKVAELPYSSEMFSSFDHPIAVYNFITNLPLNTLQQGSILLFKNISYKIFDIRRHQDTWLLACSIG
jgi:hypothetical protein